MSKQVVAGVVLICAAWISGCAGGGGQKSSSGHKAFFADKLEPYQCGTITRLHTYGGIFLASQPKPEDFAQAKDGGIKTVINLRRESEITDFNESEVVTKLGLKYINLPWSSANDLTDEIFNESRKLLNTAEKPILLHCASANRVGAVWFPWRVLDGGLTVEAALEEAKTVGMRTPEFETKGRDYIARMKAAKP